MNYIDRLVLHKYLLFKHFDWSIIESPLWVIRGVNKDAVKSGHHTSGNAVGKTLIFNALATLWLAQPPFSNKKNSAKELVPKGGYCKIYGRSPKPFTITQQLDKKLDYQVSIKGKALNIKDISEQRKAIQRLLKLNADHFYSFVYVHSFRPSPLQIGSASQRHDFIESLFNLRIYDLINKKLLKIANNQKMHRMQLPKLKQERKQIKITPEEQKTLSKKLKAVQQLLEERLGKLEKINETIEKYNTLVTLFEQLKSNKSGDYLKEKLKDTRKKVLELENKIEKVQKAVGQEKVAIEVETTKNKLLTEKKQYQKILKNCHSFTEKDRDSCEQKIARLLQLRDKWVENEQAILAANYTNLSELKQFLEPLLKNNVKSNNLIERVDATIDAEKESLSALNHTIAELSQLQKHQKCPTCFQAISKESLATLLETTKENIANRERNLQHLRLYHLIISLDDKLLKELTLEEIESEHRNEVELLGLIEENLFTKNCLSAVNDKLNDLPKITRNNVSKETLVSYKKELAQLQKKIEFLTSELSVHKRFDKEYSITEREQIRERYKKLKNTHNQLSESILPLNETVQKLSVAVNTGSMEIGQLAKLRQEIKQIEKETEDYDIIQTLLEIYSPKGVRIQHIETLTNSYIAILNQYSRSIFSEKMVFSAELKGSTFSIMATRRGKTSDINSLSGSESRAFSALSALALRILMPEDLKPNIMALDEVEAGMSKTNRELFFTNFVPLMQEHVPNLIIVTPQSSAEVNLPNAKQMTLVREKGVTNAVL